MTMLVSASGVAVCEKLSRRCLAWNKGASKVSLPGMWGIKSSEVRPVEMTSFLARIWFEDRLVVLPIAPLTAGDVD